MSLRLRIRTAIRRAAQASVPPSDRWRTYLAAVEPAIASEARVHRFARPPLIGRADLTTCSLAVWIEDDGSEPGSRTRSALATSEQAPAVTLGGTLSEALGRTMATHVALLRVGDVLAPLALERLGQAVSLAPDAAVITCDDDRLDSAGRRHDPRFRPGPSPDRWLAVDDSGPLLVVARESAAALAGRLAGGPAWRHELALRLAGPRGASHAHVPLLLCHRGAGLSDPPALSAEALGGVLRDFDPGARVESGSRARRVRRRHGGEPIVEVIVCLRDKPELLARCVDSLLSGTDYARITLALVDNGSREAETLELLGDFERDARVRVLRDERQFNFAALNNLAARTSAADVLVFLNNDTRVEDPAWIETLLDEAQRPEVGAVAPMLLYPDGTVQHAGAAIGLHGYAGHPFATLAPDAATPFGSASEGTRNWLAVTAACMMLERHKFDAVGGFDESFIVAGNDVDLCLRLTAAGYRSVCVPHTMLLHDESRSRGTHVDPQDFVRSEQSYGRFRTVGDPFYNPNLTLESTDCGVRRPGEAAA